MAVLATLFVLAALAATRAPRSLRVGRSVLPSAVSGESLSFLKSP